MFGFFKKRSQATSPIGDSVLSALIASRGIKLGNQSPKDSVEVAALCASFLIKDVMKRSSIEFAKSNEGRRVAIGLLALVACDCASRIAKVRFEPVALLAFSSLFGDQLDAKSLGAFFATSTRVFNASTDGITEASPIAQFGQSVMGFFRSNNDAMLEGIGKVFPIMIDLAAGQQ